MYTESSAIVVRSEFAEFDGSLEHVDSNTVATIVASSNSSIERSRSRTWRSDCKCG